MLGRKTIGLANRSILRARLKESFDFNLYAPENFCLVVNRDILSGGEAVPLKTL